VPEWGEHKIIYDTSAQSKSAKTLAVKAARNIDACKSIAQGSSFCV